MLLDITCAVTHHEADFLRRTSYPTSGYSLGTRGRRSPRDLRARPRRRTPVIRLLIVVIVLLLGSRAFAMLQNHHDMRVVAATKHTPTPHPAVAARPAPTTRPAPTPTPSPSRSPVPAQLPQVKVPVLSANWLRTHPIAEVPSIKGRAAIVVDLTAGQILYQQDQGTRYADASLTKMMTAMVAADLTPLDTVITVPDAATDSGSSRATSGGAFLRRTTAAISAAINASINSSEYRVRFRIQSVSTLSRRRRQSLPLRAPSIP